MEDANNNGDHRGKAMAWATDIDHAEVGSTEKLLLLIADQVSDDVASAMCR